MCSMQKSAAAAILFSGLAAVIGPAAATELPQGAAQPAPPDPLRSCPGLGPGYFQAPGQGVCLRLGLDLIYQVKGDLAQHDIEVQTQRILNTPLALYQAADISKTATRYLSQTSTTLSLTAVSPLGNQALVAH